MSLEPVICRACSLGPCKTGDLTKECINPTKPTSVNTVQDMVNLIAIKTANPDDKH